ncbi:xyloglucan galactosyltransferase KATAMARI1 homolog [Phragmites australis]|uniref:xyloglucan galactosyltransferase KATAMARI1 homolog n=1 Tax=Phragmites australis TaxID=29695 RepID=UPI002D790907|nr:xyloglucan galactosyltransferase KATAMARI1 homolog [Phragmites australis]
MKRHHAAAELPLSAPAGDGGGLRLVEEEDKQGKFDKAQRRCSRLCFLLVLAATVSMLARHCYDSGLAGGVVRVEGVPKSRKIVPIARGELSISHRSPSAPEAGDERVLAGNGEKELSKTSASVSSGAGDKSSGSSIGVSESDNGDRTVSEDSPPAPHGDQHSGHAFARALAAVDGRGRDLCGGRYIYVQELPPRFNADMVRSCGTLSPWTDMCGYTANGGFGPQLRSGDEGEFQETGWYDTDQHALDVILHDRIRRYECLTDDPSLAAAVFVPFYAGLDVARHLWGYNVSTRDALALELADLLTARPEWRAMGGRDHFFVAGRTTWDFRRLADGDAEWGSKLFGLPAIRNMTALVVEASPWHLNDAAIPYPTAFHPACDEDLFVWQDRMRGRHRPYLFSFAGAPRPGDAESIFGHLAEQCTASPACSLVECSKGSSNKSESPTSVMKLFQSSTFCLLPRGSTSTTRSTFDAVLAGCIPVFFHPGTAYVQYTWHLPKNHTEYSVYIPEADVRKNASVEERLRRIPPDAVERMRNTVVGLIPTVTYSDASSRLETTVSDAFDVAVAAVIDKVAKLRSDIVEGRAEDEKLEMYSWKYPLLGEGQKAEDSHEWDALFAFN